MAPRAYLLAVLLVFSADAHALDAPASYRYRIQHQIFGDIGEHRMAVRREDDLIVVEHTAELAVEILGLTAFRRRTRFREVWRDDRLIEFEGLVEDNGEPFPVSARAEGNRLVVEGSAGRIEAPAATVPSEPSLQFAAAMAPVAPGHRHHAHAGVAPRRCRRSPRESRRTAVTRACRRPPQPWPGSVGERGVFVTLWIFYCRRSGVLT
jgi:hypothetical protein